MIRKVKEIFGNAGEVWDDKRMMNSCKMMLLVIIGCDNAEDEYGVKMNSVNNCGNSNGSN